MLLPPHNNNTRPRTLAYVSRTLPLQVNSQNLSDPDIQVFEIQDTKGAKLQLINVYNEKDINQNWTLDRCLYNLTLLPDVVLAGDFNTRHPSWDPTSLDNSQRTNTLYSWLEDKSFLLRNAPSIGTFYRAHMATTSVLDLTFTRGLISRQETNWHTIDIGSDHLAIGFAIPSRGQRLSIPADRQTYNVKKADWESFTSLLIQAAETLEDTLDLDKRAQDFADAIAQAAHASIPQTQKTMHSKPWWTLELRSLRRVLAKAYRTLRMHMPDPPRETKAAYLVARNGYFQAIKSAKRDHWNKFLENTAPKSIYKAMAYTKPSSHGIIPTINGKETFLDKCEAFRSSLFPAPPLDTPLQQRWASYAVGN
jgi:hypothetical protein